MNRVVRRSAVSVVALAGVLLAAAAFADPPSRVARLNYIKGSVSFRPATLEEWGQATLNHPLTTGDHLWTDADAWTEMHVGSTAIRMAPQTAFAFLNLDDRLVQMRLSEGALDVRVRHLSGEVEIDTPSAAISLTQPGTYRVEVLTDEGSTRLTVRDGAATVYGEESPFTVDQGQTATLYGTDRVSHEIYAAGPADEWERWCRSRDARDERSVSLRYVSYDMTGYEDLDEYGTWSSIPEYGWAWQPRYVTAGWAPYRYGRWGWVDPWGWTWIDDAAWGFAPFHYGRWAHHRGGWWWVPGAYVAQPIYSPALVAFIGGDGWGLSFGFGYHNACAWFPLAPGEFWMPYYHASHGYIRHANRGHVHHVDSFNVAGYDVRRGTYVNRAVAGGVTAVPRDAFVGGRAVPRAAFAVDRNAAMRSPVIGTGAPMAPRAESVLQRGGTRVPQPTSAALRRAVVARNEPAAAPVPFQARERALQVNGGRPLDDSAMAGLRGGARASGQSPVRMAGARSRQGEDAAGAAPSAPADRAAGLAVPRGGERARTYGGAAWPDRAGGAPSAPAAAGSGINDRPGWARPRAGADAGYPAGYGGGRNEAAAPGGARTRAGGGAWGAPSAEAGGDRPAAGAGGARPRGEAGAAWGGSSSKGGAENDRPAAGAGSRGAGGSAAPGAIGGARPRGGTSQGRPSPGAGSSGSPSSPSGRPPGDVSGARPRSSGGQAQEMRSWGGDFSRPASSFYRPAPQYGSSSSAASDYRPQSRPTPQYGSSTPGDRATSRYRSSAPSTPEFRSSAPSTPQYRSTPQYGSSAPSIPQYRSTPQYRSSAPSMPQYRSTPQYRSSAPSMPQYRSTPQYRSSAPSIPQYRSTPQHQSSAPSMPQYRSTPQYRSSAPSIPQYRSTPQHQSSGPSMPQLRSSAPSVARPSGGGRTPSFSGGGSRSSGGAAVSRQGGGSRSGGSSSSGTRSSGGSHGGTRQRNKA